MSTAATITDDLEETWSFDPPRRRGKAARAGRGALAIVFAIAAFLSPGTPARAQAANAAFANPGEARSGALLLKAENDRYIEAPRLGTDVDLTVSGPTLRARVTQIFHNPTNGWVEAVYVYPLPEVGAVDTLKMVIGDRIVVGELKERLEAKQIYERAKAAGRKASLVEQERPNIFTNSVANIGPGETVLVQIEYQEAVRQTGNELSLRVPLVVAPRYNPKPLVQTVDLQPDRQGWGTVVNDPVPDRDRIEPPVLDPRVNAPVNPVQITVRLQAGFKLGEVKSHHHLRAKRDRQRRHSRLHARRWPGTGRSRLRADLEGGRVERALRRPVPRARRQCRLRSGLRHAAGRAAGGGAPPARDHLRHRQFRLDGRHLDHPGQGEPPVRAQPPQADRPLQRHPLRPHHGRAVHRSVPADAANIAQAQGFVTALQARGGTEMVPPMKAALTDSNEGDSKYLRQVVFLTDGEIGNEQQLFDTISAMRGRSRVFMVGIGSAPNSFLMTRAAELGRGTFTHISSIAQVEERMRTLVEKLESRR